MANPQQQVDSYLGDGTYDEWMDMDKQTQNERARYDRSLKLLRGTFSSLTRDYKIDLDLLDRIAADYRQGINILVSGRQVSKAKLDSVRGFYVTALATVEHENDLLEALVMIGLVIAMVLGPLKLLQARSVVLSEALKELEELLKEAEEESRNVKIKTGLHVVINVLEAIQPEMSLLTRATIYFGDVVADKVLGPKDPTTLQKVQGYGVPAVKQFSEAVHGVEDLEEKFRHAAHQSARGATAATFYIDYNEIMESSERVEKLKELIEKTRRAYDSVIDAIQNSKPALQKFYMDIERAILALMKGKAEADSDHDAWYDNMYEERYSPPTTW